MVPRIRQIKILVSALLAFNIAAAAQAPNPKFFNERFVITAMRAIHGAEATFQATTGNGDYGTAAQLRQAGLIDSALLSGQKYGYQFVLTETPHTQSTPARFVVTATPTLYRKSGLRSYYIDELGEMHAADKNGTVADANDPYIDDCALWGLQDNERCTLLDMRGLHGAEATYAVTSGFGNYGMFTELYAAGLIRSDLADYDSRGYIYSVQVVNMQPNVQPLFKISAVPRQYGVTGIRSFFIDQSGVIRGGDKNGQPASENDPPINN
jgi:hypothetical protein